MVGPEHPINLTPERIDELNRKLCDMRHDINGHLTLVVAAVELMRLQPASAAQRMTTIMDQVPRITGSMAKFTKEFEAILQIRKS